MELISRGVEGLKYLGNSAQLEARKAVSGTKYRYQDGNLDLDLTYITPNIIAMGFPAVGAEKLYRNDAEDVASLLNTNHYNCWRIFNVSENDYRYICLNKENVKFLGWNDHHAPPMDRLIDVVLAMDEWMSRDPSHVMAVHCMAGKSRTGTVICCYLLYKGIYDEPQKAIEYFNQQRGIEPSLELPSQIRYVNMFYNLLKFSQANNANGFPINFFPIQNPISVILKQILITPIPLVGIKGTGWTPLIEIHDGRGLFANPPPPYFGSWSLPKLYSAERSTATINTNKIISGDVMIKFYHSSSIGKILLFRLQFHTSLRLGTDQNNFLDHIEFTKEKLDTILNCADLELKMGGLRGISDYINVKLLFGKIQEI